MWEPLAGEDFWCWQGSLANLAGLSFKKKKKKQKQRNKEERQ